MRQKAVIAITMHMGCATIVANPTSESLLMHRANGGICEVAFGKKTSQLLVAARNTMQKIHSTFTRIWWAEVAGLLEGWSYL